MVRSSACHLSLSKGQQDYAMLDTSIGLQIYRKVQTRTAYDRCLQDQYSRHHTIIGKPGDLQGWMRPSVLFDATCLVSVSPIVFALPILSTVSFNLKPSTVFYPPPIMSLTRAHWRIFSAASANMILPGIWSFVEQRIEGAAINDRNLKDISDLWFTTADRVEIAI
jgi:hypothetical protein